jgi:hypothetical protein
MDSHIYNLSSLRMVAIINGVLSWRLRRYMLKFIIEGFLISPRHFSLVGSLLIGNSLKCTSYNGLRFLRWCNPFWFKQITQCMLLALLGFNSPLILFFPDLMGLCARCTFIYFIVILLKKVLYIEEMLSGLPSCLTFGIAHPLYQIFRLA